MLFLMSSAQILLNLVCLIELIYLELMNFKLIHTRNWMIRCGGPHASGAYTTESVLVVCRFLSYKFTISNLKIFTQKSEFDQDN